MRSFLLSVYSSKWDFADVGKLNPFFHLLKRPIKELSGVLQNCSVIPNLLQTCCILSEEFFLVV